MKTYLEVIAKHCPDGKIIPLQINWEDGRSFEIDKILDCRPAPSLKAGGLGIRYRCRIRDNMYYLFHDEDKWFIERVDKG